MIDPVAILNSSNTHIPGVILGSLVPDGAGGYALTVSMEWTYGVLHYALQPVLLMLVIIVVLAIVALVFGVMRR